MNYTNQAYDIIIQAGQSNAEGCGRGLVTEEYIPEDDVLYLYQNYTNEDKIIDGIWKMSINVIDPAFYIGIADERSDANGRIGGYRFRMYPSEDGSARLVFMDTSSQMHMLRNVLQTTILLSLTCLVLLFLILLPISTRVVHSYARHIEKQKQFVTDANHELKTPLTVITTNAELMKSEESDESKNRFTDNILTMSKQMRGLVESMLEIARLDNGGFKKEFSVFDLSETVSEAVLPFEALFFEKEQNFSCEIETGIKLNGNSEQIKQVVDILLDNANKYAAAESDIRLILKKQGRNQCRLSVSNEGETIPEEELKNIFKRFYRGDKTRQMNNSYGLGLSIAESIVKEHSGKIFAESKNGTNTFTVQFHTA